MRSLQWYITQAKARSHCNSDRKLCALMKVAPNALTSYKKGVIPTDETMIKLAKIAGVPAEQALLDLNIWRSEGSIRLTYQKIAAAISQSVTLCFALIISSTPAHAFVDMCKLIMTDCIYYGKYYFICISCKLRLFLQFPRMVAQF